MGALGLFCGSLSPSGVYTFTPVGGGGGGGGAPAWVQALAAPSTDIPTDALLFQTAQYYSGASEQAVAALLGGGFDASKISASGMACKTTDSNRPTAIGDLFTSFAQRTGTYVFDLLVQDVPNPSAGANGWALYQYGDGLTGDGAHLLWYGTGTDQTAWEACNIANGAYLDVAAGDGNAVYKVAMSIKADGTVVTSFNGAGIITDEASAPPTGSLTTIFIGAENSGAFPIGGLIRKLIRYDLQPDADLPTLSA